ncbi:PepSY domain-containing protein [Cohnella silvisoli]|uniref:PepSY domain-containing protein n=1 Tax=Cohnella silvisoli TaxID=2873699 RepID=A0ABV1KQL0_9BACL|nr:PepSY domain-containing protein [Cohnella silvisoli]MCD9022086.1 PepSY domain-containing protein [Cohnella silvisoli]
MKRKNWITVLMLAAAVTAVSSYAIKANAGQDNSPITAQDQAELLLDGVTLKKPDVATALSNDQAISIASKYAPGYAKEANEINAEYQLMTNNQFALFSDAAKEKNPKLNEEGFLKDTPVYIVTFKGITKKGHALRGQEPVVNHEFNVVVDANSGEVLYAFTYR